MIKIGVTGGIGSGKSTVCRLFADYGVPVYDSDRAARRLMNEDPALRRALVDRFGADTYTASGELDRPLLASRVFGHPEALRDLDALVHPAVMRDFAQWCTEYADADYVLLESAILFEAGLEGHVDRTLAVMAPRELRIERAAARDGSDREAITRRIAAQMEDDERLRRADYTLVNIERDDLERDVADLNRIFLRESRHATDR